MIRVAVFRKDSVITIGDRAIILRLVTLAGIAPITAVVPEEGALSEIAEA